MYVAIAWADEARISLEHVSIKSGESTDWANAIATWYAFETTSKEIHIRKARRYGSILFMILADTTQQMVSLSSAPKALCTWMRKPKHKRSLTCSPAISNVNAFGADWRAWWTNLQPNWRSQSRRGAKAWPLKRSPFPEVENWCQTKHRGEDGFFLILQALGWWASGVRSAKERREWMSAVDDVLWVLQHF